jgi:subfamily B ATP-binding cassette protein MsbA
MRRMSSRPQARLESQDDTKDSQSPRTRMSLQSLRGVSWRRLLSYVAPYRWQMVLAIASMFVAASVGLALPLVVGQMVDMLAGGEMTFTINQITIGLIVVVLVQALFNVVRTYLLSFIGERVVSDLRVEAFAHMQRLSLDFFNNRRTGELTSRLTNDISLLQSAVTTNVATLLQGLVQLVGAAVLMIVVSWQLSSLALVLVPAAVFIGRFYGRKLRQLSTIVQDRLADSSNVIEESVSGIRIVKSFAREPYEIGRFSTAIQETFDAAMHRTRVQAVFQPLMTMLAWGTLIVVLWLGARMVFSGQLQPGDLVAFVFYAGSIAGTVGLLTGLFTQIQQALGATTRVFELLDTQTTIPERADLPASTVVHGRVTFDQVDFAYAVADQPDDPAQPFGTSGAPAVLRQLSLEVAPGEMLALVGPSGAGKSTIANLIPRFYDVRNGSVAIDGRDVREMRLEDLRGQIAIVPQETLLFSSSVRENIRYGRLDATEAEIVAAAQAANADAFIRTLPDGYDTLVGERGIKLSGGQRQRLAIARAILKDARILILDEATSALDTESERLVQEALERLMHGRTSIVIAHRLSTIQRADRIAVIVEGTVRELGSHQALLAQGGVYARLYAMQFRAEDRAQLPVLADLQIA